MAFPPHPPEVRAEVARLLRETDLTAEAIAARTGVAPRTVRTWNARMGHLRPPRRAARAADPAGWTARRREALARLHRETRNDLRDLAAALGLARRPAGALFRGLGLRRRRGPPRPPTGDRPAPIGPVRAADAPALRAALRGHIARQIAAFDAALAGEGAAVADPARVLRDLGGLKRLLDDLGPEPGDRHEGRIGERAGDAAGADLDLPALRASLARRARRVLGGGASHGPSGCPAPPAPPRSGA